jgi:polysaccharide chain length determinant protein (PEP-CTERM system associated)
VALVAVSASLFVPKVYEAKSTVFIEKNVINSLMTGIAITPAMTDRIRVLRYYMVSRDIVSRTLKKMEMDTDARFADPRKFEGLIADCAARTKINMRGEDLFFVSMTHGNPYFARDYINTLITIYVEENLAAKRDESYGASRFLSEQIATYKRKLDEIDAKIIDFRRKVGIYSNASEGAIIAQIGKDEDDLSAIRLKKNELSAVISTIEQQLKMLRQTTSYGFNAGAGIDSSSKILQLQKKINELLLVYNDKHPSVVKLKDQIEELQKRHEGSPANNEPAFDDANYNPSEDPIFVDLKMRLNLSQSELNSLVAKERDLTGRIAVAEKTLRNFPEDKKILSDLERERANYGGIYENILQRVGISEVSKDMEVADKSTTFRIVDPAILPTSPVGVQRILLMLAGICAGFAAGLGTIFVLEKLDDSIKDSRSIKELGVTLLAEIPLITTETESLLNLKRDKAVYSYASVCTLMVAFLLLHGLMGFSFIDNLLSQLQSDHVYRSPYGS